MHRDDLWSPGQFMDELFHYYDTHSSSPNYFVLSSGINLFPLTRTWKKLIYLEIEQRLTYPFYTSPLGFPCSTRAVMARETFAATEGKVYSDEFALTACMTIGAAQAVAIVFAYLASQYQTPSMLLLGLNHPLFEQLARHYHIAITELIGEERDTSPTLPCAEIVAQEILRVKPGVVVLVQPNNPSGEVYTEAELTTIFCAARETEALLLLDQVGQLPISFDPWININKAIVSTQTQSLAILAQSFSKTDGIPGFRIGYLAVPPAMVEFVTRYQQRTIMNPPTALTLPIFLASLARCIFLGEQMEWLRDAGKRYLARFFSGLGKISLGELPACVAQELAPTSLLDLSNEYIAEQLQNYTVMQENQRYLLMKLQPYISRKTACKGGFNCLVEFAPFAHKDEFTVCRELFQSTQIALLPESSFRVYKHTRHNNFWVRVSLAVPQIVFQENIDTLERFLARQRSAIARRR